jgi:hypothetical protein
MGPGIADLMPGLNCHCAELLVAHCLLDSGLLAEVGLEELEDWGELEDGGVPGVLQLLWQAGCDGLLLRCHCGSEALGLEWGECYAHQL